MRHAIYPSIARTPRSRRTCPLTSRGHSTDFDYQKYSGVHIQLWDYDRITKDDFLGECVISMTAIRAVNGQEIEFTEQLLSRPGKNDRVQGTVTVRTVRAAMLLSIDAGDDVDDDDGAHSFIGILGRRPQGARTSAQRDATRFERCTHQHR